MAGRAQVLPLWLDCDPGHDDAMAIILAGYNPSLHLLGVSTVAGNQTLEKVTQNALDVLDYAGLSHIPVVAGQAKPLLRPAPLLCPEIHGGSGLDGPQGGPLLPRSTRQAVQGKAVNVMYDAIQRCYTQHEGKQKIQLVCTGALTNCAALLILYPEVVSMVDVTIMGGAMGAGNTGPVVEFNIQTDPEAAHVVFNSGVTLTMVPLEVTHTVLVDPWVLSWVIHTDTPTHDTLRATDAFSRHATDTAAQSPFRQAIKHLMLFFKATYKEVFGFEDPPLHDPVAVAAVIAPELFQFRELRVDIETNSVLSAGQTVCDIWRQSGKPPNCRVATAVDVDAFWVLMLRALACADRAAAAAAGNPGP